MLWWTQIASPLSKWNRPAGFRYLGDCGGQKPLFLLRAVPRTTAVQILIAAPSLGPVLGSSGTYRAICRTSSQKAPGEWGKGGGDVVLHIEYDGFQVPLIKVYSRKTALLFRRIFLHGSRV